MILDSMVLINLAEAELLPSASRLREKLIAPAEVLRETVSVPGALRHPHARTIHRVSESGEVIVAAVQGRAYARRLVRDGRLSEADAAVVALARERRGIVGSDDARVRRVAEKEGIPRGGTGFLLSRYVVADVLDKNEARSKLDGLIARGWWCDISTYRKILEQLGF